MAHPQTIQIFLPAGDPQGIRLAEIPTRIVRVIEVPRNLVGEFLKFPEAEQTGVYFLFGDDEASGGLKAYIGQTGSLRTRLTQQHANKDFWNKAVIALSLTNSLTNTHVSYLEWLSIQQARAAGRYALDNGNSGACPHTPAPLLADCSEIYETIAVLLATLGYPIFDPVTPAAKPAAPPATGDNMSSMGDVGEPTTGRLYSCKGPEADAKGISTNEGFVVLAESTGRAEAVPSFQLTGYFRLRQQLIQQGVLVTDGLRVRFARDALFKSPSAAAACVLGRTANGPLEWRDDEGRSLWEVELQSLESVAQPPPAENP